MQSMRSYDWAQDKVEQVTGLTREQRESQACQRRLVQMEKKRQKQIALKSKATVSIPGGN